VVSGSMAGASENISKLESDMRSDTVRTGKRQDTYKMKSLITCQPVLN